MLAAPDQPAFKAPVDAPVRAGVRETTGLGIAEQIGAEAAFRARDLALEPAAVAFPRFAAEGATVISF